MSEEELTKLESALKSKDENTITEITISHSNAERVKLRQDYKAKFNRELLDDLEKYTKSDLSSTLTSIYKDPVEYDTDLLYKAMKGIGTNDEILIEVISFRTKERLNQLKEKFKEKYGKELIDEIKSETSGEYRNTLIALFDTERSQNKSPDLETCKNIAQELYKAGEGKIGTNDSVFVKYFTTLSAEELMLVGKEYHKSYKKTLINIIDNEIKGDLNKLFKCILYALISPSEYFARQINNAVKGLGTNDTQLIRSIVSRADVDMDKIKKYYKKLFKNDMAEDIKGDTNGNYQKVLLYLIGEK
jgi:annexin A7/11